MKVFRLAALLATLMLISVACSDPGPETFGQDLYEQSCAVCHGASGEGTAGRPAIGSGSNAVSLTDDQLRGVMAVGPGAMPSFNRLSEEQIDSLVVYIRELQSDS